MRRVGFAVLQRADSSGSSRTPSLAKKMNALILAAATVAVASANPIALPATTKIGENCIVTLTGKEARVACEVTYHHTPGDPRIDPGQMVVEVPVFVPAGTKKEQLSEMLKVRLETEKYGVIEPQSYGDPTAGIQFQRFAGIDRNTIDKLFEQAQTEGKLLPHELPLDHFKCFKGMMLVDAAFSIPTPTTREFTIKVTYTQPIHEGRFVYLPQFEDGLRHREKADFKIVMVPEGATKLKSSDGIAGGKAEADGKITFLPQHGTPISIEVEGSGDKQP